MTRIDCEPNPFWRQMGAGLSDKTGSFERHVVRLLYSRRYAVVRVNPCRVGQIYF
jgi:hypothetical protein